MASHPPLSIEGRIGGRSGLSLPQRKRNYRFAMTPLADAMFQLLIFFMLSSSLTPYSLLPLQTGTPPAEAGAALPDGTAPAPPAQALAEAPGDVALWQVEPEAVIVGGQRFGFEAIGRLAAALTGTGRDREVMLVIRPSARVQDISTVLAWLRAADVTAIRLGAAPAAAAEGP